MRNKILNSLIVVSLLATLLTLTSSETQAAVNTSCQETQGTVIAVEIPTTILSETIDTNVYLPACYNSSDQRYAVLYLLHGMGNNADQWVSLGAPAAADQMSTQFIIVMPHDRLETSFNAAFVNEIVPFIDENFRTIDDRNYRAIGGLSYGGGWAIHIGLSHPELFSRIGGHSPALFYGDSPNLVTWAQQLLLNMVISIDIGDGDPMLEDSAAPIDELLTEAGAQHTFNIYAGGHNEDYWATHIGEYVKFYTTGW
ncbi:MAG: hypothetical protein HZB77_04275 [Chloroflexi bacterium]|nr:hypothetical protein [Chloroflexota bacterium]MBI5348522.1 hypothetical protein [Chloroflexota bacterium]